MNAKPKIDFEIKKPENFDLEKGRAMAEKIIREKWLKEMAKK